MKLNKEIGWLAIVIKKIESKKNKNKKKKVVCNLRSAGTELEETGLAIGGGRLAFQLLDFPTFSFSLFL